MTVNLRHLRVSTVGDNLDPNQLQGPDWNAAHTIQQGPSSLLGRADATAGQANTAEILLDASLAFLAGKLAVATGTFLPLAGGTLTGPLYGPSINAQAASAPSFSWNATSNSVDQKLWDFQERTNGTLYLRALNDAFTVEQALFAFSRAGGFSVPGTLSLTGGTGNPQIWNTTPFGQFAYTRVSRVSGANPTRWDWGVDGNTESGASAGSDFFFTRWKDDGTTASALTIRRSDGQVQIYGGGLYLNAGDVTINSGNLWSYGTGTVGGTIGASVSNTASIRANVRAASYNDPAYSPAFLSIWRGGYTTNAVPANSYIGSLRYEGFGSDSNYAEFGDIGVSLQGANAVGGGASMMNFLINEGGATPEYMKLDGLNKQVVLSRPINIVTNVNAGTTAYFTNTNTGSNAYSSIQINSGGRWANIDAVYVNQFIHEYQSGLPTRYTDYDSHNFRTAAGTTLLSITASQASFSTPMSFNNGAMHTQNLWLNVAFNSSGSLPPHGSGGSIGWNYLGGTATVDYVNNYGHGYGHRFFTWNTAETGLVDGPLQAGAATFTTATINGNMSLSAVNPIISLGDTTSGVAKHLANIGGTFTILRSDLGAYLFQLTDTLGTFYKDLQIGGISGNGFYFSQTAAGSVYPNLGVVGTDTQINFVLYGKGGGSVYLNTSGPAAGTCAVATSVDFTPGGDNTKGLGRSGLQWSNVYSVLGTFSGTITSTKGSGAIVSATGLGTNGAYNLFSNTGNTAAFGIEGSTAGSTWAGTAAYATLMGGTAAEIDFATVNVVRFSIATGGVTSTVPITMPTPAAATENTTVATTAFVKTAGATATSKTPAKFGSSVAFTSIGTYVSSATTGSIGAAGQVWLVFARVGIDQTVAAQHYHTAQIWNGAAAVDTQTVGVFTANTVVWTSMFAIVTLTAATTFTVRGTTDATSVGSLNGDSMIGAVRLG